MCFEVCQKFLKAHCILEFPVSVPHLKTCCFPQMLMRISDFALCRVMCYTLPTETPAEGPIKVVIQGGNGTDTVTAVSTTHFKYVVSASNTYTGLCPSLFVGD